MKSKDDVYQGAGIIAKETDKITYLYVSGLKIPRTIRVGEGIFLSPVVCDPNPDDMINCMMKNGNGSEYDLGVLISTLRYTTSEIVVIKKSGKDLAIATWNSQWTIIAISAILNCHAMWYFQSNRSASEFGSSSNVNIVSREIVCVPHSIREVTEKECEFIEKAIPVVEKLEIDSRFQTAISALWSSNMSPRPAIQAMIIWGGIESLFLIKNNIKNRLSEKISDFLNDESLKEEVKDLYNQRSKSVHEFSNNEEQFVKSSKMLLHRLIRKCIDSNSLPVLEDE
ncbi:MAG: hypothetical protein E7Z70_07285 [Thermoplasmata archaeon]|nr:hypothetical protein [Thermoplasmata archaeon]